MYGNMKKLSLVLALLLVAALVFGGVTFSQKGNLQKTADELKASVSDLTGKLEAAVSDSDALKTAQTELEAAKADLEGKLTAATDEAAAVKADLEGKLAAAADEAAAMKADLEGKLAAAADEAAAAVEEQIKTLTGERDDAQKALDAANGNVAALETQIAAAAKLIRSDLTGCTVILHSNDVHGALEGYAYMKTLYDWYSFKGANVILADVGDFSQGSIYVSTNKGKAAIDMMNTVGYDLVTLGNHEFDFGYANLMENLSNANFTTLCCNVILDETSEPILPATSVYELNGLKIAFVGVETPETATKVNPGMIKEIHFSTFDDLYKTVQAAVDSVKDEADIVIGLCHLGVDTESAANGYRSYDLLNHVTGIDFVIDGHSHTVMEKGENGEPIQSTGTAFANIGVIVIDNEQKAIVDNYLYPTAGLPMDETVLAKAKEIIASVDAIYGAPFATSEVELNGAKAPGNRTEETNLGDLITDAMVWSVVKEGGIEQVEPNHVIGITNGGGIRAAVKPGDVAMKDINTVLPFGNTVAVIYVTGDELLEALEASTFCTPDSIGGYPQTSGITWTLDTTKEFAKGEVYTLDGKESSYFKPASIQRVTIEKINGEDFDPAATYAVVTNNFCAAGGDTYNVFARAYNEGTGFDTGIPLDEAVMGYVTTVLEGKITAEQYGAPRGSQTQIK